MDCAHVAARLRDVAGQAAAATARGLGGNAPEDHGSGLLDGFQTLAQEIGVSVPKLDVVLGRGSGLRSPIDWQTTKATASASVSRTCLVVRVRRSPRCSIS